jgi:hypothetical protein
MKNGNLITELKVTKIEVMLAKDHFLFLMLGIYEDFDDDLLYDAMELLINEQ